MPGSDFLARIKLVLEGKDAAVKGLQQTQAAAQQLSTTKIVPAYDKAAVASGKQIAESFKNIDTESKKAAGGTNAFLNILGRAALVAPLWMVVRNSIQAVVTTWQESWKFLIDMENAMARIQIVGKGTAEELKGLQGGLVALSYAYGVSASEALKAAQTFAQQGRTVRETFLLTRAAMIGAQVLGTDIVTTVNNMTAAIEGFQIPVNNATSVVDKWIAVEKEFAVTAQDLADATKVSAASAHQLGMSISEFLGDVTAVIEVTRKSGSEAARGLSFIYARLLTSAKPVIEQITKIPFYLDKQGKATSEITDKTRSLSDILGDLAAKWSSLTVAEKLEIATAVGSKRQMTILNALMQNYSRALDATVISLTSAGQAEKAFAIIQDTATYKTQKLVSAFMGLVSAVGNTAPWKAGLDILSKWIVGMTGVFNFERGMRTVLTQQNAGILANVEARKTEIDSLQELLTFRDKLAKMPATTETTNRLNLITQAIDKITEQQPEIKLALSGGSEEDLQKAIQNTLNRLEIQKISANVSLEFAPKILALEEKKRGLQAQLKSAMALDPSYKQTLEINLEFVDREIVALSKQQTQELEKQYILAKAQRLQKDLIVDDEQELVSTALTEKEKEQLAIEQQINIVKIKNTENTILQLEKEIELVRNSKFLYDAHDKTLKLQQLQNQLLSAQLEKRQKAISNELELAQIRGASNMELLRAEVALKAAFDANYSLKNDEELRLKINKELTKEKMNQVSLSSETVTLYKIAKEEGLQTAKTIGEFVTGKTTFEELKNMPRMFEVFKKYFSDWAEQLKMAEFLGVPFPGFGKPGREQRVPTAKGAEIPIPEMINIQELQKNLEANFNLDTVNIAVTRNGFSPEDKAKMLQDLLDKIATETTRNKQLRNALEQVIEEF